MYYRVLVASPGLEVEVTGEGLEARCALRLGEGPWVEVPLEVASLLWWADGARTVEALHELAQEVGATLSLERVEAHLRAMEAARLVSFATLDGVAHALLPGSVPHVCVGCGRSCEGHLVGPLPPSEVEVIRQALPGLQALEPALVGQTPFMVVARKPGVYLRLVEGRCVFLGEDRRCRIHKHLGAAAKPSICRMFPYVRALTEEGYRFTIAPGCSRHHTQARTAPGEPALGLVGARFDGADVSLLRLARGERARLLGEALEAGEEGAEAGAEAAQGGGAAFEDRLVLWLGEPGVRLRDLIGWVLGEGVQAAGDGVHVVGAAAVARCGALGTRLLPALEGERSFIGNIARQGGPFAASLRALMGAIRQAAAVDEAGAGVALPRQTEAFMLDALRRSLFIRDALSFQDTARAVAGLLVGWVIALAATAADVGAEDATHDAACALWAAWYRVIPHSGLGSRLFEARADAEALLRALAR